MEIYQSSEITVHKLNELREEDSKIQIIDVREDTEREHAHIKGTIHMKLSEIANRYTELDKNNNIFVIMVGNSSFFWIFRKMDYHNWFNFFWK